MNHRVAVTGMGLVTALGSSVEETWRNLVDGQSGVRPVTLFDVSTCRAQTAALVRELPSPDVCLDAQRARYIDRAGCILLRAAREAVSQAVCDPDTLDTPRSPVRRDSTLQAFLVLGTTGGGMHSGELFHRSLLDGRRHAPSARLLRDYVPQQQANDLQEALRIEGPILITANACATGANVVGYGFHLVRTGQWETVICAGYDAVCEVIFAGFDSLQAITTELCRPFDRNRSGLVLGEGAAVFVLESFEHARQRGAKILGEIAGYGQSTDTHHLTQPHPEGDGALLAMQRAITSAEMTPADIHHVNAHGTATSQNDAMESKAIRRCFGTRADEIPVTSVKAAIGHLLGAAGAAEAAIGLLSLQRQCVPPTLNYETPDPACNVAVVGGKSKPHWMRAVLSNSFGFGGANATLVFKAWKNGKLE